MTTITYGDTTITPTLVDGWSQARSGQNVVHPLIAGGAEYTLRTPMPRSGVVTYLFADEADALAAEQLHITAPYVDIVDEDRAVPNGRYIVDGEINLELEVQTRDLWVLRVGFREVVTS